MGSSPTTSTPATSTTYDAIYFRPFNFRTSDPARRLRAVQYISHPTYTWNKLRAERPGVYEKPVNPALGGEHVGR